MEKESRLVAFIKTLFYREKRMTQNCTMKLITYSISIVLLVICVQITEAKQVYPQGNFIEEKFSNALAKPERDLRGIKDVWANIRESAIRSWNLIKTLAEKTKQKINIYIENVKEHANNLKQTFKEKLAELKDKLNQILSDIYGTGELVNQCIKKEKEKMDDIIKEIIAQMGQCVAEEINTLTQSSIAELQPAMNETKFLKELDDMVDLCERDMEDVRECLCKVREDIFENFTGMQRDILDNNFQSRDLADDIKGTLVTCSIDNLIVATTLISDEIVEIAKCVLEAKENEAESSE